MIHTYFFRCHKSNRIDLNLWIFAFFFCKMAVGVFFFFSFFSAILHLNQKHDLFALFLNNVLDWEIVFTMDKKCNKLWYISFYTQFILVFIQLHQLQMPLKCFYRKNEAFYDVGTLFCRMCLIMKLNFRFFFVFLCFFSSFTHRKKGCSQFLYLFFFWCFLCLFWLKTFLLCILLLCFLILDLALRAALEIN